MAIQDIASLAPQRQVSDKIWREGWTNEGPHDCLLIMQFVAMAKTPPVIPVSLFLSVSVQQIQKSRRPLEGHTITALVRGFPRK
jgi:hypothetical protein